MSEPLRFTWRRRQNSQQIFGIWQLDGAEVKGTVVSLAVDSRGRVETGPGEAGVLAGGASRSTRPSGTRSVPLDRADRRPSSFPRRSEPHRFTSTDRSRIDTILICSWLAIHVTSFLVATSSVHVTAAAADYLADRLDPAADEVVVVAVDEPGTEAREAGDAVNVARSRLAAAAPTTETRTGDPADELSDAVAEHDPDEVLIGPHGGRAGDDGVGSTAQALLRSLDRPVVVVPLTPQS